MQITSPESVGMSSERLNNIHTKLQTYIDKKNVAGFITLIARKGQVIHYETCGYRDVEHQLPMEKDTIIRIYSMTKPITSVGLMMLYEQGKFQLYDPVSKFIPTFGNSKVLNKVGYLGQELVEQETPMTIQQLLTHTSGLSYGMFQDSPVEELYRQASFRRTDISLEESIKIIAELPLKFQPGEHWNYSVATDVCGYLVQVISGLPFETFLEEKIFDPLGMIDTHFHVPAEKVGRFARLYQHNLEDQSFHLFEGTSVTPVRDYSLPTQSPSGGGGLVSTTEDYLKFMQLLLNKGELEGTRLLGRKTLDYMAMNHLKPQHIPFSEGPRVHSGMGFGLGFAVVIDAPQSGVLNSVGNYGWGGAAATKFWIDPQEELVAVIMTQLMDNKLPFQDEFRTMVYQALID